MSAENRLSADELAALAVGDTVTIESGAEFNRPRYTIGTVLRLTATHAVVRHTSRRGVAYQEQYRLHDGIRAGGGGRAELVNLDLDDPSTRDHLRRRTQRIDAAYRQWSRHRADVEALRELQEAISAYMAETLTSP